MIASVHIADIGPVAALGVLWRAPRDGSIPGLRHANVAVAAPLSGSVMARPQYGRVALLGFWEDDGAVEAFTATHPLAEKLNGGWSVRLDPLRIHGSWPGVPDDIPTSS